MHKSVVPLLLALAGVVAVVLLVWPGVSPSLAPTGAGLSDTRARHDDPELVGTPLAGNGTGAEENDLLAGIAEFARQADEATTRPALGRPLVVQIWNREKGRPAAGAEVFALEASDRDSEEFWGEYARHWGVTAENDGERFVADASGRVVLPAVREWMIVAARLPEHYGITVLGREHKDVEHLLLRPDETLTVRVVDGEGRPVEGAPVGIVHWIPTGDLRARSNELQGYVQDIEAWVAKNPEGAPGARRKLAEIQWELERVEKELSVAERRQRARWLRTPRPTARPEVHTRRRTDEHGLAVFRHLQDYRDHWREEMPSTTGLADKGKGQGKGKALKAKADAVPPPPLDLEAALLLPLSQPVTVGFPSEPVTRDVVELRLPPTGSVVLRTVDLDGEPFLHPVHGEVALVDDMGVSWGEVRVRKEQGADRIVFPAIGLGLQLRSACWLDDDDFSWDAPPFMGPTQPGEVVQLDLVVAPTAGMLRGRLVDPAGSPVRGEVTFLMTSAVGRMEGEEVDLAADGGFHLPYKVHDHHRAPFRLEIRRQGVTPIQGLAAPLASLPEGRVSDLGELVLDAFGEVARGVVRNDLGEPVEGARIQLERQRDVGDAAPELAFVEEAFVSTETSAGGEFALFGALDPGRYRLRVEADEHFELESEELRVGSEVPMELVMMRRSQVIGEVLRPEWLSTRDVRVTLQRLDGTPGLREGRLHDYRGKTYVYFDWVRPGSYALELRTTSIPDPFLRVAQFVLEPGFMGVHPQLAALDIGSVLHRFQVRAIGPDGEPMSMPTPLLARIVRPDGTTAWLGFPWKDGTAQIISASHSLELLPTAPGLRAARTVVAPGESRIQFQSVPNLEVRAPGLPKLLGGTPAWIFVEPITDGGGTPGELLTWNSMSQRIAGWHTKTSRAVAPLREDGTATLTPLADGVYRVTARIGAWRAGEQSQVPMGEITVQLSPGRDVQPIDLGFDVALVQRALAALPASGR